jgi:2-hydroxy-3-oxopropionate reductase
MKIQRVGFIGLGAMGLPMAVNLLKAGYTLTTYVHRNKTTGEVISGQGGNLAGSPAEIARQSEVIFLCLPTAQDVETALFGPNGVVEAGQTPCIVDCSTHDLASVRSFHQRLLEKGLEYLDAPISGGPKGAENASLGMMVGGNRQVFEALKPVLEKIAANITYVGESGLGQAVKLANNLITSAQMVAISEAFTLAIKAGVKPATLYQALQSATADSKILNLKAPGYIKGNYQPGFRLALNHKDLGLILKTGRDLQVPLFLSALVDQLYGQAKVDFADLDSGAVALLYQKISGVSFADPEEQP